MSQVYIVSGSTGEYDDFREWDVAAFLDQAAATRLCEQLNAWCLENDVHRSPRDVPSEKRDLVCPLDPQFRCDFNGVNYAVREIPLRTE